MQIEALLMERYLSDITPTDNDVRVISPRECFIRKCQRWRHGKILQFHSYLSIDVTQKNTHVSRRKKGVKHK